MEMFEHMVANSEAFYQSLKLPYRVVAIVSGALNNAAAIKYDVEAWFPYQGEYKELQSISNCSASNRARPLSSGRWQHADVASSLTPPQPTTVRQLRSLGYRFYTVADLWSPLSQRAESRSLEVRCGLKKKGETTKNYVHMLNGTLCATERALCQSPDLSSWAARLPNSSALLLPQAASSRTIRRPRCVCCQPVVSPPDRPKS
jgi:seryl-tRNA synthetase